MRKIFFGIMAMMLAAAPASAQSLTDFFKSANLDALAQGPQVVNLEAQSANKTAQTDVNTFDDFFLINGSGRLVVNFDKALQNKGQVTIKGWIGATQFSNHDIAVDLQDGFTQVAAHFHIANARGGRLVVYKTLNTQQLVYDYAVQGSSTARRCQEYLFTPAAKGFVRGVMTSCFWTLQSFKHPGPLSSGRLQR